MSGWEVCLSEPRQGLPTPRSNPRGIVLRTAALTSNKWDPGQTITISFIGGTANLRYKVRFFAAQWLLYANVEFLYTLGSNGDVRIAFVPGGGHHSYIGTDCRNIPPNQPTMNLAFTDQTPDDDIKSTTLHEFGHMLGLVHEHSQPLSPIQWNRPVVYREYAGPPNFWTPADVDRNIFNRYNRNQTQYSQFDPQSIMLYSFPPHYTINGFGTMRNWDLSVTDKDFIAQLYPFSHQIVLDEIVHINPDVLGTGRNSIIRLEMSPDGAFIAAVYIYDIIDIYYTATGLRASRLHGTNPSGGCVRKVRFRPLLNHLAVCYMNGITLWDSNTGQIINIFSNHAGDVADLDFAADGTLIASGADNGYVCLWRPGYATSNQIIFWKYGNGQCLSVAISRSKQVVVGGFSNGSIQIWSVPNGYLIKSLSYYSQAVASLCFSLADQLVSHSYDDIGHLWDVSSWLRNTNGPIGTTQFAVLAPMPKDVNVKIYGGSLIVCANDTGLQIADIIGKRRARKRFNGDDTFVVALSPDPQNPGGGLLAYSLSYQWIKIVRYYMVQV